MIKHNEIEKGQRLYFYSEETKKIESGLVFDTTPGYDFFTVYLLGYGGILADNLFLTEKDCIVYMNDTFTIGEKKCKEKLNWNRQHLKNIKKIAKEKGITLE